MTPFAKFAALALTTLAVTACVAPAPRQAPLPPATPNFVFNPPDQATKKLDKAVAIVGPKTGGSMWSNNAFDANMLGADERARSRAALAEMLKATRVDLEKVVIARGFNTVGPFVSADEMTFSQKERSFVMFEPQFDTSVDFAGTPTSFLGVERTEGTVTTRGSVTLAFYEPLSKEKVWLKRLDLPPASEPYLVNKSVSKEGRLLSYNSTQGDAVVRSLNKFYAGAMAKIWAQVDAREISALQQDVDQLKAKKRF